MLFRQLARSWRGPDSPTNFRSAPSMGRCTVHCMQNTVLVAGMERHENWVSPAVLCGVRFRISAFMRGSLKMSSCSPKIPHNPHFALWTEMREKNQVGPAVRSGTCRGAGSTACGRRAGCVGRRVCTGRCVSPPLQQERSKSPSQLRPMSRALVVCALASLASADAARFNCTHSYEVRAHTRRHLPVHGGTCLNAHPRSGACRRSARRAASRRGTRI